MRRDNCRNQGELIWTFALRELLGKYRGTFLGLAWSFLNPLLLLVIYTLVFSVLLKVRFGASGSPATYAVFLFCGMVPWIAFSEMLGKAPQMIRNNLTLAKKTIFPLEILVVSSTISCWFHSLFALVILLIGASLFGVGPWHMTFPLVFLVMIPQLLLTLGLGWMIAALGVFVRDAGEAIQLILRVGMFLTPIFYPLEIIPEHLRPWVLINPMANIVEAYRDVLLRGVMPDFMILGGVTVVSGVVAILGYSWFMKTKKAFADVI